ncbi:MAG: ImmA/IrrE family metallo-endopeptidase [Thermoanaerobacter sp.]|nr:ImmA/IrrE family metallo-endopeptidase [Thermoanaerobacter sp.]
MRKPTRIRATWAKKAAQQFLQKMNIHAPPVPVKQLLKKLGRLFYFYNWQEPGFAKEDGFSLPDKNGTYRIYINKDLPAGRDNFTYAHETAHIVLKHHEEFDIDYLTDLEYKIIDREADIFATELLMPKEWVLTVVHYPITVQEIGRLKDLFQVSWEAMINRLDDLGICTKEKCKEMLAEWRQWKHMLAEWSYAYSTSKPYYKIYTAERGELIMNGFKLKEFKFPEVDENMRFLECPTCGNTDFSPKAKYCKKCGQYLYNSCNNVPFDDDPNWCGEKNVGDALFCEYCGTKTVMYDLLERMGLINQETTNEEVAVALNEDDIPF